MAQPGVGPQDYAPILDMQFDHLGKRLATASQSGDVLVWDAETRNTARLSGHRDAVWAVTWAHPMFGSILASAGEDKYVIVWCEREQEQLDDSWEVFHRFEAQGAAIAAAFAPWEYDLQLAVASSDGKVTVLSWSETTMEDAQPSGESKAGVLSLRKPPSEHAQRERWTEEEFFAHDGGAFCICWGPAAIPAALGKGELPALEPRRLVTGGADKQVMIWRHTILDGQSSWLQESFLPGGHEDWVRDVAWRPNMGIPSNTIASCSEDGALIFWHQAAAGAEWKPFKVDHNGEVAWQLRWSLTGSILAVSTSENEVLMYKESPDSEGVYDIVDDVSDQDADAFGQAPEPFALPESAS